MVLVIIVVARVAVTRVGVAAVGHAVGLDCWRPFALVGLPLLALRQVVGGEAGAALGALHQVLQEAPAELVGAQALQLLLLLVGAVVLDHNAVVLHRQSHRRVAVGVVNSVPGGAPRAV